MKQLGHETTPWRAWSPDNFLRWLPQKKQDGVFSPLGLYFLSKIRYICSHLIAPTPSLGTIRSPLLSTGDSGLVSLVNLGSAGLTGQRKQAQVAFVTLCSLSSSLFPGSSPWCLILPSQEHR